LLTRTNIDDAIPFDQNHLIGGKFLRSVEQSTGADRNPVIFPCSSMICDPMIRGQGRLSGYKRGNERANQ
jgi:hypothetical protein